MDWNNRSSCLSDCTLGDAAHGNVIFIAARACCWKALRLHPSGCTPGQSDICAVRDYCIPGAEFVHVLLTCSLRLSRCLYDVSLSSSGSVSSPSMVSFVHFAMYELYIVVWCMNIYHGRRVSGLLSEWAGNGQLGQTGSVPGRTLCV